MASKPPSAALIGVPRPTPGSEPRKNSAFAIGVPPVEASLRVAVIAVAPAPLGGFGSPASAVTIGPVLSPVRLYSTSRRGMWTGISGHPGGYPESHWYRLAEGPVGPSKRNERAPVPTRYATASSVPVGKDRERQVPGRMSTFPKVGGKEKSTGVVLSAV